LPDVLDDDHMMDSETEGYSRSDIPECMTDRAVVGMSANPCMIGPIIAVLNANDDLWSAADSMGMERHDDAIQQQMCAECNDRCEPMECEIHWYE
jgi:hypothetical protein